MLGVKVPLETFTEPQVESVWAKVPPKDSCPWYQSTDAVGLKAQPVCRTVIGEAKMNDAEARIAVRKVNCAIVVENIEFDDIWSCPSDLLKYERSLMAIEFKDYSRNSIYLILSRANLNVTMHCLQ